MASWRWSHTPRNSTAPDPSPRVAPHRWQSDTGPVSMTVSSEPEDRIVSADIHSQAIMVNSTSGVQMANNTKTYTVGATSPPPVPEEHTRRELKYADMLDLSLEHVQGGDNNWRHYHTRTGQMTGYWRQRQGHTHSSSSSQAPLPPWKPAFSPNSFHLDSPPTLCTSSTDRVRPSERCAAKRRRCRCRHREAHISGSNKIEAVSEPTNANSSKATAAVEKPPSEHDNSIENGHGDPVFWKGNHGTVDALSEGGAHIADDSKSTLHADEQGASGKLILREDSSSGSSDHHIEARDVQIPTGTNFATTDDIVKDGTIIQGCEIARPSSTSRQPGRDVLKEADKCSHQTATVRTRYTRHLRSYA